MKTETLSAAQNAREEGRECASEWQNRNAKPSEAAAHWRDRCRANIVRAYEAGHDCPLCQSGTSRSDFDQLLAEWDAGFDETITPVVAYGPANSSCNEAVQRMGRLAAAVSLLLDVYNIVGVSKQPEILALSSRLADDLAGELAGISGGAE